jgi:hypothetical protein
MDAERLPSKNASGSPDASVGERGATPVALTRTIGTCNNDQQEGRAQIAASNTPEY